MSRKTDPAPRDALRRKGPGKFAPGDSPAKASLRRGRAGGSSRHVVQDFDIVQDILRRAGSHPWEMLPGFGEGAVAGEVSKQAQSGRPGVAAGLALAAAVPVVGPSISRKLAKELAKKGGKIAASAIKMPDGRILEGHSHFDAMERGKVSKSPMLKDAVVGYVDQSGSFLTLDEAGKRLKLLGVTGDAWKNARSEEILTAQKGYAPKFKPAAVADSVFKRAADFPKITHDASDAPRRYQEQANAANTRLHVMRPRNGGAEYVAWEGHPEYATGRAMGDRPVATYEPGNLPTITRGNRKWKVRPDSLSSMAIKLDPATRASRTGNADVLKLIEGLRPKDAVNLPRVGAVDKKRAAAMAKEYEKLPKNDPAAAEAYRTLNEEVEQQFKAITDAGYKVEFVDADPYKNSEEMMQDVAKNKRLRVFKTGEGQEHPFMTADQNNKFRAVHDFFAHAGEGHQFGPTGEENAYRVHASMLSPAARRALATETRGQNSWVNFGPNAHLPAKERPFAEQKAALWPEHLTGDYDGMVDPLRLDEYVKNEIAPKSSLAGKYARDLLAAQRAGRPAPEPPHGLGYQWIKRVREDLARVAEENNYVPPSEVKQSPTYAKRERVRERLRPDSVVASVRQVGNVSEEPGGVMGLTFDTPNGPINVRFTHDVGRGTPLDVKTISTPEQGVINDKTPGANTRGVAAVRAVFEKLKEITGATEVTGKRVSGANPGKQVDRSFRPDTLFHGTFKNFDEFKLSDKDIGVHLGTPAQAHARLRSTVDDPRIFIDEAKGDHPQLLKVVTPYSPKNPPSYSKNDPRVVELPDLGQWKIKDLQEAITQKFDNGWEVQNLHTHGEIRDWLKTNWDKGAVSYQNLFEAPEEAAHSLAVFDPKEAQIIASLDMSVEAQQDRAIKAAALKAKGATPKQIAEEMKSLWRPRNGFMADSVPAFGGRLLAEEIRRDRAGTVVQVKNGEVREMPRRVPSARRLLPFADTDFAAVMTPSGKIFRGPDHDAAYEAAWRAGYTPPNQGGGKFAEGFALKDGKFVDRERAAEIFGRAGRGEDLSDPARVALYGEELPHSSDIRNARKNVRPDSIPEQRDLPRMLPKKKSQSLLDEVEERTLRAYMGPKFEKWLTTGNFGNWYDTFGTEQAARDALGDEEGPAAFKRLMDFMGATTARSSPSNNLRRAGYYRGLENAGLLDFDALLGRKYKKVPEGMGHIANDAHQNAMATLLGDGSISSIANPKPASFTENLKRNQRPFTNDTRMATGLRHVDPVLEKLGAFTSSTNPYGGVTYSPRDWAYAPMERAGQRAAAEYANRGLINTVPGLDPTAFFQAKVWDALGGEIPGASRSAGIFDDVFKSKLDENARRWGMKPSEANKLFWQGHPFDLPLGADVVPRGLLSSFR